MAENDISVKNQEEAIKTKFPNAVKFYYYSDPTASKTVYHHYVIPANVEDDDSELPWRWHRERPDDSLKDPVWSNDANGWVENDQNSQGTILAQTQAKIIDLTQAKEDLDQDIQDVREVQKTATKQSSLLTEQLASVAKGHKQLVSSNLQTQQLVQAMYKQMQKNASADTKAADSTDKTTDGGNN